MPLPIVDKKNHHANQASVCSVDASSEFSQSPASPSRRMSAGEHCEIPSTLPLGASAQISPASRRTRGMDRSSSMSDVKGGEGFIKEPSFLNVKEVFNAMRYHMNHAEDQMNQREFDLMHEIVKQRNERVNLEKKIEKLKPNGKKGLLERHPKLGKVLAGVGIAVSLALFSAGLVSGVLPIAAGVVGAIGILTAAVGFGASLFGFTIFGICVNKLKDYNLYLNRHQAHSSEQKNQSA